jgi:hypothetical protein
MLQHIATNVPQTTKEIFETSLLLMGFVDLRIERWACVRDKRMLLHSLPRVGFLPLADLLSDTPSLSATSPVLLLPGTALDQKRKTNAAGNLN